MPIGLFSHALRLLDQEIVRVRTSLIHIDGSADERQPLELPEPDGAIIQRKTRVSIPVEQYPEHNFVGRIIGPRGLTIQELEVDCGCKLYVRGKGSLRNKEKEEKLRGQPNWEHLNDDLHVMIVVEDSINRAEIKLNYARDQIQKLIDSPNWPF
ncbi:Held out wings-like protein [Euroglyphus maynei]|uniref:Held out wings-like protein n=1 Tax=Euroglyphus maynei TaxID=6958 RepID=A0A1Y3BBM3_EURMA|nr:Held out wings-like protein [Euroglyphus maynei]